MQQNGLANHDYMQIYPISYDDFQKETQRLVSAALSISYS